MPFWHLKIKNDLTAQSIAALCFLLSICSVSNSSFAAEQITITGRYPNFAITDKVVIKPQPALSGSCEDGTIYVTDSGELRTCERSVYTGDTVWTGSSNHVYIRSVPNPADLKVVIGDDSSPMPLAHFNIVDAPTGNQILFHTVDAQNDLGIVLSAQGTPSAWSDTQHYGAYIDFHVENPGGDYDGRIKYFNRPTGKKGFGLYGVHTGTSHVWLDRTHNVGIGTEVPASALDVNGNLETERLFIRQDGTNLSELKVEYDSAGGGGYYAVYAP